MSRGSVRLAAAADPAPAVWRRGRQHVARGYPPAGRRDEQVARLPVQP